MTTDTRIKINLNTGEIEFEGSQEFVEKQLASLSSIIDIIHNTVKKVKMESNIEEVKQKPVETLSASEDSQTLNVPDTFGEWYNRFPSQLLQNAQVLVAAYFDQKKSQDDSFKTFRLNKLLKEQGIKVANAASCISSLQKDKYVIKLKKEGSVGLFRVSKPTGVDYLAKLLQKT